VKNTKTRTFAKDHLLPPSLRQLPCPQPGHTALSASLSLRPHTYKALYIIHAFSPTSGAVIQYGLQMQQFCRTNNMGFFVTVFYSRGRAPSSGFSDWPARKKKKKKKKGRPSKVFIRGSKLQAGTSNENQHADPDVCSRLLPLHPRLFSQRLLTRTCGCGPGTRYPTDYLRLCVVIIIRSASL
jgi:hypothetical protein